MRGNNIVGRSGLSGFLYNGSSYTTLSVPGGGTTCAYGISGNNVVGFYNNGSGAQGFLATPVPEPSLLELMLVGSAAFLGIRQRWHR